MNTLHSKSVQNSGHITQDPQSITFFMVIESESVDANVLSPRFETLRQAQAYLNTVENIYEDAFIAQFTSFSKDAEERARLAGLIVRECAMSYETILNDVVTWFFVTQPVQKGNQLYRGIPISTNFRTKNEAEQWLAECGHDDAYIVCRSMEYYPTGREATEADIFDGECPAKAICYMLENQQT